MTTLRTKQIQEDGRLVTMKVEGGLHYIKGNNAPYFTLTYSTPNSGGCGHKFILQHYPEFEDLAAMHLSDIDGSPMHAATNAWYWLAGCYPDAFGERYHGGNSEQNFPCAAPADKPWKNYEHRKPTGDECLTIFAKYVRVDMTEARKIRDDVERVAMSARHSRNQMARQRLTELCEQMHPRWKAEAEACIAKHGLVIYGDKWPAP